MLAITRSLLLFTAVAVAGCAEQEPAAEAQPATAQPALEAEPAAPAPESAVEADSVYVVSDRAPTLMAAWDEAGQVRSASGAQAASSAPTGATRYEATIVRWPTATVKVLTFSAATGGVLHPLTDETLLYVLEGQVETTVNGEAVALDTGDVASLPEGAITNIDGPADAVVVAWTAPSLTTDATPAAVKAADVEPRNMGLLTLQRYEFPGNSVRAVGLGKGLKTNPNSAKTDSMIYVTKGPLQFFQNGEEFIVNRGDFIREVAGATHNWDVTEDSGFVTTSALPVGAGPIDPNKATDIPN
jgi:quercetin dioxygenase-like cupin family protein